MVYKFKVFSTEDENFFMDIEIKSTQTLYDLHDLIQDELEYDRSHLASFFVSSHNWQRKQEIPLIDMGDGETLAMDKAILKDVVKDAHQKFIYVFDYMNDRFFHIELVESGSETPNLYYPICTDFGGEIPPQFGSKANAKKKSSIFDEDDDFEPVSRKPAKPVFDDDDFDADFAGGDSFEKDIAFDFAPDAEEDDEDDFEDSDDSIEDIAEDIADDDED